MNTAEFDSVYSTIIHWDIGGGKHSRRELARRIVSLYAAEQQASKPLTHEQAKALAERYGNDPLNLIFQTEKHHGITGEEV